MDEEIKNEETKEEEVKEEAATEASASDEPTEEKPLEKMTAPELKDVAKKIPGVTGVTAMKKADLLALIKKQRGIVDEEPDQDSGKKDSGKKDISVKEIKKKIVDLKAAKAAAQESKNKKETDILRRRINRLKKMTRKAG